MNLSKRSGTRARITRQKVAATAIQCFDRYGIQRTSMSDIADMLGASRQTIYRVFESRPALLEYIATARVNLLSQKLSEFLTGFDNLEAAIVEGVAYSIRLSRSDELLVEILRQEGDAHFKTFLFGGTRDVQSAMMVAWGPLIAKSRESGNINPDIPDADIIEWLCNIGAILNLREDYQEDDCRRILRQFVAPSLRT